MTIAFLILGLVLLVAGGDLLVRGGALLALALGLSPLMIGLTLIGFGTSTPELTTSVQAALIDAPGVAVGNVVGSNICNILLILGLAALLRPVPVARRGFLRDGPALALATGLCIAALLWGEIGRLVGFVFVALLLGYVALTWALERAPCAEAPCAEDEIDLSARPTTRRAMVVAFLQTVGGIAAVIVGADFLVDSSVKLAQDIGVSDTVIGLTVVAVATSLPDLATSVAAALRGRSDIAFGAVVGSNIYNILGILGIAGLVSPMQIPERIMAVDGWIMLAATAALALATITGWRINRMEGGLMLGAYAGYLGWMAASA